VNLFVGGFVPRGFDARDGRDVILDNNDFLATFNRANGIDVGQFNGWSFGGEYLIGIGPVLEAGLGLGYYQRTVPASYIDFVNEDGTEIVQEMQLRTVPFTATFKLLPFSHEAPIQPYVGGGVGVIHYRYSETGMFIDFSDPNLPTFNGRFVGSGTEAGPVALGGVRAATPFGTVGFELRYQWAVGNLPPSQGFSGSKIDLGGMNYLFTMSFRF
jgi:hypothetical protein